MIKRINMISLSVILTIIVFIATTAVQRFFVSYEPTVKVLVAVQDIQANRPLDRFMFKTAEAPLSLVMNLKVIKKLEDIRDRYSVETIHKGEILRDEAIALKNEVKIIEVEQGKEKISIKVRAPENAVSFQIKAGDKVNLYFTGRYGLIKYLGAQKEIYLPNSQALKDDDYSTVKILDNSPVMGIFDDNGNALGDSQRDAEIDTVVFAVSHEDSIMINSLKGQGTFDITGLPY